MTLQVEKAPGATSLSTLLCTMNPSLDPETYIFLTFPPLDSRSSTIPSDTTPTSTNAQLPPTLPQIMTFGEPEGTTLITTLTAAKAHGYLSDSASSSSSPPEASSHQPQAAFPSKQIRLDVQSSLEAIGFLAVITRELGAAGIPTNAVSAFFHDYLFVPVGREEEAMRVLLGIKRAAEREQGV